MTRLLGLLSLIAYLLAPAAEAQDFGSQDPSISGSVFAKAEGDDLLVAIELTPDYGCYFYDDGKAGDVGGLPTEVSLSGPEGVQWGEVWFPEATFKDDEYLGEVRYFKERTVLYAAAPGAAALGTEGIGATVNGQACNDRSCLTMKLTLSSSGAGDDALWAGFPAALLVANTAAEAAGADAQDEAADAPVWEPEFAQSDVAKARFFARVDDEDVAELVIQIATPEGWHMYGGPEEEDKGPGLAVPTTISVEGGGVEWEQVKYPRPEHYVPKGQPSSQYVWIYEGTFHFGVRGDALEEFEPEEIEILINGQSCDVNGCVPIENMVPEFAGEGDEALYAAAFSNWVLPEVSVEDEAAEQSEAVVTESAGEKGEAKVFGQSGSSTDDGLLRFILLAIGAGLITLLMPCTYPMIPITISFFTKQADSRGGNVLSLALVYGLGIISIFVAIGVIVGPAIATFAGHYITNLVIGVMFVVFALSLFGMFELRPPAFLMQAAGSATQQGGFVGVFLMGLTLVITSFTCTAPFVGTLLAAGNGKVQIAIGMFFFGLTMATPFVFLALVPGRMSKMPSAGAWMNTLKVFMGFVELAASLKFFSNADYAERWMIIPREVFLILWAGIFLVAGMYLLGRINLKGESPDGNIGPGRMLSGLATVLFGFYCFLGTLGFQLDGFIMAAMAPPPTYSRGLVLTHTTGSAAEVKPDYPAGIAALEGGPVAIDDYDVALDFAREKNLGLMINFTAHT